MHTIWTLKVAREDCLRRYQPVEDKNYFSGEFLSPSQIVSSLQWINSFYIRLRGFAAGFTFNVISMHWVLPRIYFVS